MQRRVYRIGEGEKLEWLEAKLREINSCGTFNCLFSDGEILFCYHDEGGYNGLFYLERKPPYGKIRLEDEDLEINLAEEKDPSQRGFIIATRPLTNEEWRAFNKAELKVFKDGELIYPSTNRASRNF